MKSKIKNLLQIQEEPFLRQDFLEVRLKQKGDYSFKDFSLALLRDCQSGVFGEYDEPLLRTNFHEIVMRYHERTFVLGEIRLNHEYAGDLLQELHDYVRRGAFKLASFRIGDNWEGKYDFDIVGFFHHDMEKNYPRLILNKNTQTRHLQPFLDARVTHGKIQLTQGRDKLIEKL